MLLETNKYRAVKLASVMLLALISAKPAEINFPLSVSFLFSIFFCFLFYIQMAFLADYGPSLRYKVTFLYALSLYIWFVFFVSVSTCSRLSGKVTIAKAVNVLAYSITSHHYCLILCLTFNRHRSPSMFWNRNTRTWQAAS